LITRRVAAKAAKPRKTAPKSKVRKVAKPKIGTLDDPSIYGGARMAIFTAEGQPFHIIPDGVPAFEGLPPGA
jgi:hypothetical protein